MKNNKGFTLVELLAIVVIMGVIVAIAVPNMNKQIAQGEKNTQTILDEKIENAAKMYAAKYYANELVTGSINNKTITLNQLQEDGLINLKSTQCEYKRGESIKILVIDGKINYNYTNIKDTDCYSK